MVFLKLFVDLQIFSMWNEVYHYDYVLRTSGWKFCVSYDWFASVFVLIEFSNDAKPYLK